MRTFRMLYFQENVLEHAEEVVVCDILQAVEAASGKPPHLRVEIWSENGRVGVLGPSPVRPVGQIKDVR